MILDTNVEVRWNGNNRKWYTDKGYVYTKHNDKFLVDINDLSKGSHVEVNVLCDYCLDNDVETLIKKTWKRYVRDNLNSVIKKDACAKCQPIKTKECNMVNFGVESKTELKETRDKIKETTLERYGVEHNMQDEKIKAKAVNTFMKNYGFDNPMKNSEVVKRSNLSKIRRFGSTNPFLDESIIQKSINTNLNKYGTEWHMQSDEIKRKSRKTMYENNSAPCSRQQLYIHNLIGGELNYPVDNLSLDIAFPEEKTYVEYDGNGHNLQVKLGGISEYEFERREIKRYLYLKSLGWKQIRIVSPFDYLPSDGVILEEMSKARKWLEQTGSGHSHYVINIGGKVNDSNYGRVRKIKEEDLHVLG